MSNDPESPRESTDPAPPRGSTDPAPPEIDVPDGWRLISEEVATPFDVRVVRVTANTRIYEDVDLRTQLADVTDTKATWRFVFASRLRVRPATPPSGALSRLVTERANSRFVEILGDRGFESIDRADTHRFEIGAARTDADPATGHAAGTDSSTEATRYRARVGLDDRSVPVEAYFAAWPSRDGEYLLGGGAYPLSVPGSTSFDPERARDELFSMLRTIR
ncbi:hypothetical protein [Halobellus captivus]|uniref:hypothetical protein n=1 Tax=Halobellus captivus TaxID=2592614 RepID=UPI00119F2C1A|nr:hypothetical protein [Halobellus captivus]